MAGSEERSRRQQLVEKAKRTTLKYTAALLAASISMIVGGYTALHGQPRTLSVALGLGLGAASPLLAFYITYRRVIKPWMDAQRRGEH